MGKRLATDLAESVVDWAVVTGVVMALTVDTAATDLGGVNGMNSDTGAIAVETAGTLGEGILPLAAGIVFTLDSSPVFFGSSTTFVATIASTWSSSSTSSRSPLRQLSISASFEDSTGRLVITALSPDNPALGLTNEIPAESSSSSTVFLASVLSLVFLSYVA